MAFDGKRAEQIRGEKGLTQAQAAEKAQLQGRQQWNDIVHGRRTNLTMDTVDRIAKALGVSPKELVK